MSKESICVPDKILKRIFDLVNQIRSQYSASIIGFSKDLSFIAGEFAVNLSLKKIPFSHKDFIERHSQAPLAITFGENIAIVPPTSKDPGHDAVIQWISKPSSLSRINSACTHTGIGVAESAGGTWYCTQIFATLKNHYSRKDELLVTYRAVNRIRKSMNLPLMAMSFTCTSRLVNMAIESLTGLTVTSSKLMFQNCFEADFIVEQFQSTDNNIKHFISLLSNECYQSRLGRKEFNEIGFVMQKVPDNSSQIICCMLLGQCGTPYRAVPYSQIHYPIAYNCLQLINDYRMLHNLQPLYLSHQWCHIAEKHSGKIMNRTTEVETLALAKKIKYFLPESTFDCGVYIIPLSYDPLREFFLIWLSSKKFKNLLLSMTAKHIGFGMKIEKEVACFATLIIGEKKGETTPYHIYEFFPGDQFIYETLTSDGMDEPEAPDQDSSFRLTG